MKLTEQQLAQLFRDSKNTDIDTKIDDLYASTEASDVRLTNVEKIADSSSLSASYQVINQLHDWSDAIGTEINLSLKPNFSVLLSSWFRPLVGAAAVVTAVYFITPQISQQIEIQQKPDNIMFNASFEEKSDVIRSTSFDSEKTLKRSDVISIRQFG